MAAEFLASRRFSQDDQETFAALTGDRNPMHMDVVAARRTQPGARVVHGMHTLLWLLDSLSSRHPSLPPIGTMKVQFDTPNYVGDEVVASLTELSDSALRVEVRADGLLMLRLSATFGTDAPPEAMHAMQAIEPAPPPPVAHDLALEQMAGLSGRLAYAAPPARLAEAFPAAAAAWGAERITAMAASSSMVGMLCPGLHSILGGLSLARTAPATAPSGLAWRVISIDQRFRWVRLEIAGGGIAGVVDAFARQPPTRQPDMATLAGMVHPEAFAGATALVIGGSRGLGEVVAKLVAAGGASVVVTYVVGRADAERVAAEIMAAGGRCEAIPYDIHQAPAPQLGRLAERVTHLYYMATPAIFRRKARLLVPERLDEFIAYYVIGFWNVCAALHAARPRLAAFYPSSIAVVDRPGGMTEYAMAKAAGEVLCEDINARMAPTKVSVVRLPRLPTDQTATLREVATGDPIAVMLPIVQDLQTFGRARDRTDVQSGLG